MERGYIEARLTVLLLIGAAGAGKTHAKHVFLGLEPPPLRRSTPLAEEAIRAMSTLRATVSGSGMVWDPVTLEKLRQMIAEAIKAGESQGYIVPQPELLPCQPATEQQHTEIQTTATAHAISSQDPTIPESSPSEVPSQQLSDEQDEEFIDLVTTSSGSQKLLEVDWVYLIDSGGQPAFHEILSLFVRTASIVAVVLRLDEKLSDKPTVDFYGQDGQRCGSSCSSHLTNEQILRHCSRAMHSRKCLSPNLPCPKVFAIGTHRDLENTCDESRAEKNSQLLKMFRPLFGDDLAYYRTTKPEQLIFPLNAKSPTEEDQRVAEQFRRLATQMCSTARVKLPMPWFLLEQYLRTLSEKKHRMILSIGECEEEALKLRMNDEDCEAALVYLDKVNMFFYRPEHLKGIVFCRAQVWLDKISELIVFVYMLLGYLLANQSNQVVIPDRTEATSVQQSSELTSESLPSMLQGQLSSASGSGLATVPVKYTTTEAFPDLAECCTSEWIKFRDYGMVTLEILKKFPRHYVEGLFTPTELLKLLTAFLVMAPVVDNSTEYMMPCLLQELALEELDKHRQLDLSSPAVPLLIQFPDSCVPAGVFTLLIAYLRSFAHWRLCMDSGNPSCLNRNCVEFDIPTGNRGSITLIDSFDYLEVHISGASEKTCSRICPRVVQVLMSGVQEAAGRLQYGSLELKPAFICLNRMHGRKCSLHLATVVDDEWVCSLDRKIGGELTNRHLVWLQSPLKPLPQEAKPKESISSPLSKFNPFNPCLSQKL